MPIWLEKYKFTILLLVLINFLLTPVFIAIVVPIPSLVVAVNFSLVIVVAVLLAEKRKMKIAMVILAIASLASIWFEYISGHSGHAIVFRFTATLILYLLVAYYVILKFCNLKEISLDMIAGAAAGFVLIGLIGGVLFEILEYSQPGSLNLDTVISGYSYYYFSFISLTSVGYGDIVPLTEAARSLTVFLSLVGQFYLAVGIAVFVGKFLNHKQ